MMLNKKRASERVLGQPAKRACTDDGADHGAREDRHIFEVIDSGSPTAALSIFKVLLERLDGVKKYFKDSKILLDMQELEMLLHECSQKGAHNRIARLRNEPIHGLLGFLSRYRVPGSRGTGKVVIELRDALEYILAQSGPIPTILRRTLIEIALRAAAGDVDLFTQVSEWKKNNGPIGAFNAHVWICEI